MLEWWCFVWYFIYSFSKHLLSTYGLWSWSGLNNYKHVYILKNVPQEIAGHLVNPSPLSIKYYQFLSIIMRTKNAFSKFFYFLIFYCCSLQLFPFAPITLPYSTHPHLPHSILPHCHDLLKFLNFSDTNIVKDCLIV